MRPKFSIVKGWQVPAATLFCWTPLTFFSVLLLSLSTSSIFPSMFFTLHWFHLIGTLRQTEAEGRGWLSLGSISSLNLSPWQRDRKQEVGSVPVWMEIKLPQVLLWHILLLVFCADCTPGLFGHSWCDMCGCVLTSDSAHAADIQTTSFQLEPQRGSDLWEVRGILRAGR